eukprot:gene4967-5615_t
MICVSLFKSVRPSEWISMLLILYSVGEIYYFEIARATSLTQSERGGGNGTFESSHYGDEEHPAKSCQDIFKTYPNFPSGTYWLQFLRRGNTNTFKERHYCFNELNVKAPSSDMSVPGSPVEMSPIKSPIANPISRPLSEAKETNVSQPNLPSTTMPAVVEDLTAGKPEREPGEPEYLNEQEQWPLAITPPTDDEMKKRLDKVAHDIQDKNRVKLVQTAKNDMVSEANGGRRTNETKDWKIRSQENGGEESDRGQSTLSNVLFEKMSHEDYRADSKLQTSNESRGLFFSMESSKPTSKIEHNATSIVDEKKSRKARVKMTLLNLKRDSSVTSTNSGLQSIKAGGSTRQYDNEKSLNRKEEERKGLFVKPGLNRGVIETVVQKHSKNVTKANQARDNGFLRDALASRDAGFRKNDVKSDGAQKAYEMLRARNDLAGMTSGHRGGGLEIQKNAPGDPVIKPNPDELHSGTWTSEVERMLDHLNIFVTKHKEHAVNHVEQVLNRLVGRNRTNRISKQEKRKDEWRKPTQQMPYLHPKMNLSIPGHGHKLFLASPNVNVESMTKSSHNIGDSVTSSEPVDNSSNVRLNVTTGSTNESNLMSHFDRAKYIGMHGEAKVPPGGKNSLGGLNNQSSSFLSNEPAGQSTAFHRESMLTDGHKDNLEAQQRSKSQASAQAHANATVFTQSSANSHSTTVLGSQNEAKEKKKTKSQLALEKAKASLAQRIKTFKQDLNEDTENNYFHWAKQPPEKTPMQLRLENITKTLTEKPIGNLIPGLNGRQEAGHGSPTNYINSLDWTSLKEEEIPTMMEINKRLNAIPYVNYAAKKTTN